MKLQIKPLSVDLQKIACEELGEVPSRIPEDLQALKTWIEQQPHLKARMDDQFLIQFLRGSKYSLAKAKEKIDYFHAFKTKSPELCRVTDVSSAKFRKFHNNGQIIPLPTPLNGCGPRILFIRASCCPLEYSIDHPIRYLAALTEVMMVSDPYASICGLALVQDFALTTKQHYINLTPSILKTLLAINAKASPLRLKCFYLVNVPRYMEQIIKVLLSLVPQKLKQRIFVCGKDFDTLEEHLPKKYLPVEYGGENGSLDQLCAEYNKVWDEFQEYFEQNVEYGTDERLRMGTPIRWADDELDCGGSFRKLNVD